MSKGSCESEAPTPPLLRPLPCGLLGLTFSNGSAWVAAVGGWVGVGTAVGATGGETGAGGGGADGAATACKIAAPEKSGLTSLVISMYPAKRKTTNVEPVFGNLRHNKRLNRFTLRGQKKVDAQWKLYCLVHNIEKLAHHGFGP